MKRKPGVLEMSAEALRRLPAGERDALLAGLDGRELEALAYWWDFWARPTVRRADGTFGGQQEPPGDWLTWIFLAGRGAGKTRSGAEWVRGRVERGQCGRVALVAPTASDVRDVMVEGDSGLLSVCPPWNRPKYQPSKRRLVWPNGAIATMYSADEPERLRGPQHDGAWGDEICSWNYGEDAWSMLMFGLRLGKNPRVVATTTPKPIKLLRDLLASPMTVVTRGSTYENRANLAESFFRQIIEPREGTRLGRQEIHAELLDDNPRALWTAALLDATRVRSVPAGVTLVRVVGAVDPAGSIGDMARFKAGLPLEDRNDGDDAGIVFGGLGDDGHAYILEDATTGGSPAEWGRAGVAAYRRRQADRIVVEANHGGDNAIGVISAVDPNVATAKVHASRGKAVRAEPVAALYEQGRVHHVGEFALLEKEQTEWMPGLPSPNRMDALVFLVTELIGEGVVTEDDEPDIWGGHGRF